MKSRADILRRRGCLGGAALLLFFLAASAPHRVHHSFEAVGGAAPASLSPAHEHAPGEEHDHLPARQPASDGSECVVLTTAQQIHAVAPAIFALPVAAFSRREDRQIPVNRVFGFDPSPCAQRAPPRA